MEEEFRPDDRAYMQKLYKVKLTVASMIRQRGYVDQTKQLSETETYEEFEAKFRQNPLLAYLVFKRSDIPTLLSVTIEEKRTLDESRVQSIISQMTDKKIDRFIIILQGDPNNSKIVEKKAKTKIENVNSFNTFTIELFNAEDLIYDITKHELVPQHIPINQEEKQVLLAKYRMNETQLPRILLSDPIAKFFGLKHGDVVKIIRKSETAGQYVTYRIAV